MAESDNPGRRLANPLGDLSSYTYQLSLYMISPEAYDAFTATGRRTINALEAGGAGQNTSGAYLIAQSGGINNKTSQRGAGFDKDLYIENLEIDHLAGSQASQSATGTYKVKFDITEPYSFSFTTKLREASSAIIKASPDRFSSLSSIAENGTRQFFILGMRFLGYDANGNLAKGNEVTMKDGQAIDPNAGGDGTNLFETYYDIYITAIKFKIEGEAVKYACTGVAPAPGQAFGTKAGRLEDTRIVAAATLEAAYTGAQGLFTLLNRTERNRSNPNNPELYTQEYPNEYKLEFIGEPEEIDLLKNASLLSETDMDKSKWATDADGNVLEQSNIAEATKAPPSDGRKRFTFKDGTPILSTFDTLIKSSSYMLNALQVLYKNEAGPNLANGEKSQTDGTKALRIGWYHVTPVISNAKWDGLKNDWSYTMTYRIETYKTPIVQVNATNPGVNYYGPHKRYEYWWTGQNKEILEYSQQLDNLFYNETIGNISKNENNALGPVNVSTATGTSTQPSIALNNSESIQNAYITSLYSPDSYAHAKIKILGDPDFFIEDHRGGPNEPYQRFYGNDGFRINANGGQVFFEIDFKEAVDYNDETGVMDINESILFFKYPDWVKDKVKGVSYQLVKVKSNFNEGVFTQTLEAVINSFPPENPNASGGGGDDGRAESEKAKGEAEAEEGRLNTGGFFSGGGVDNAGSFGAVGDFFARIIPGGETGVAPPPTDD